MNWSEFSPEQKGNLCQRIYGRLQAHGPQSATGLMHALGVTLENLGGALSAMEQHGAVARRDEGTVELWRALPRSKPQPR